ncbi:MAG: hypothetical protein RI956_781 [Pseudomonadota bacterium]|jgi:hypothetical protein
MNNMMNDLEKFAMYSETYWDLDLPSKERSRAKRNLKNLVKAWEKKNIVFDCLVSILNNNYESNYVKLDAASSMLGYKIILGYASCSDDMKDQAILVLKNLVAENKTGSSMVASGVLRMAKIDYYDPVMKKYFKYEKQYE